ncbi:MAG: hypothetical protein ACYDAR_01840 [Thermomicrobiales bacterium]
MHEQFTPEPPIYTFRVRMLGCAAGYAPENATAIQREIEIAANHTLGDLGFAILDAYDFGSDHLWSFFLSGKAWDKKTEYAYHVGDWESDDEDDEEILDLFPEGSEMRKLALLAEDPAFEATEELPAEIDRAKLQAEMVAMLKEAADEAPEADRALIAEFAQLVESDPNADPAKMSEALQRYLFEDWQPDDEEADDSESALASALFPPGLAGLDLPFLADLDEDDAPDVDDILIRDVPYPGKTGKKEFLFLFDYGDEWEFGVKLLGTRDTLTPKADYPRITATRGEAPLQYPPWDEDDEWEEEDEGDEEETPRTGTILHLDPKTGTVTRETIEIPPKKKMT